MSLIEESPFWLAKSDWWQERADAFDMPPAGPAP